MQKWQKVLLAPLCVGFIFSFAVGLALEEEVKGGTLYGDMMVMPITSYTQTGITSRPVIILPVRSTLAT